MEFKKEAGMNFYCEECNFGCNSEQVMQQHKEARHKKEGDPILEDIKPQRPQYPIFRS